MKNWVTGIPYEIAFWKGVYSNQKSIERLFRWSKYNKEFELDNFDAKQFLSQRENPIIVDAGCGMSFCYGETLDGKQLNVRYIDPLAPFFNKIIEDKKLNLPKITFGFIEYLSAFVPGKASLIIVQNALDHSKNPLKGIVECIEILEIGGVLYLHHHPNEAKTENYRGFHQYNISLENDEMMIWNKETRTNVNSFVQNFATIQTSTCNGEVIAVITKTKEIPTELIDRKQDIADLCNQYIGVIQDFNSAKYSFSYHWNFFKFRIVQAFAQRLSWKMRMKIKNLMSKIVKK